MPPYRHLDYTDELLADGTVHRRYSDGRQEWRSRGPGGVVHWRDSQGRTGVDEPLGPRMVKRTQPGSVLYGREAGYGRTLWGDGVLTVNRSSFGGRIGAVLATVAGGALLGALVLPPSLMSPDEEEALRSQGGGDPGGDPVGGYDDRDDAWDDAYGDDDDFG